MSASGPDTTTSVATTADPLVVETVERLLAAVCTHEEIERAEQTGWSATAWAALADAGFPWVGIDEARGGSGGTLFDLAAVLSAVGRFAAPVPVAETAMLGGWCLALAGLPLPAGPVAVVETAPTIVDDRLRLDVVVAWARHAERIVVMSEPGSGRTDVLSLRPDQVTVTAGANLAGEARDRVVADVALPDVEQNGIARDDLSVDLLHQRGALSRVVMAAGALRAMAQLTVDYTNERHQFGKPVATFQAVQYHLVTAAQCAVRAQMAADVAVRALAGGKPGSEIAFARVVVDDAITLGTRAAHQAHGAMGVTREYDLQQLTRRLWSWRSEWGTTKGWRRRAGAGVAAAGHEGLFDLITDDGSVRDAATSRR